MLLYGIYIYWQHQKNNFYKDQEHNLRIASFLYFPVKMLNSMHVLQRCILSPALLISYSKSKGGITFYLYCPHIQNQWLLAVGVPVCCISVSIRSSAIWPGWIAWKLQNYRGRRSVLGFFLILVDSSLNSHMWQLKHWSQMWKQVQLTLIVNKN